MSDMDASTDDMTASNVIGGDPVVKEPEPKQPDLNGTTGSMHTTKQFYTANKTYAKKKVLTHEEQKDEVLTVKPFLTNPANVSYKAGITINIGNYESVTLHAMVSLPCYVEEIAEAFNAAKEFVDVRLKILGDEVRKQKNTSG